MLSLFLLLFTIVADINAQKSPLNNNETNFYSGSYNDFLREARKQDKIAILDFWAAWSPSCEKMDKETFNNPEVAKYINEQFLIYRVNVDTFDGMEIANRFKVESFPTLIKLNSRGRFEKEWKGFFPANYLKEMLRASASSSPI